MRRVTLLAVCGWALLAGCEPPPGGAAPGTACAADDECGPGVCELGRCLPRCDDVGDCPPETPLCADVARADETIRACTPTGELRWSPPVTPGQPLSFALPSSATAVGIVVSHARADLMATVLELRAPDGTRLAFPTPDWSAPVRYDPSFQASGLVLPQTPDRPLVPGRYALTAAATRVEPDRTLTTMPDVPVDVEVRVLLGPPAAAPRLHLTFHFLDLAGAPCWPTGEDTLDAVSASRSPWFQALLAELRRIFATVPIAIGDIRYVNLGPHPELDPLDVSRGRMSPALGQLLSLSAPGTGDHTLDVFFVKTLDPSGISAISSAVPSPLDRHGTAASGTVLSLTPLCRGQTATDLGRLAAHELAHLLGLYHVQETDGTADIIADTVTGAGNLMHFSPAGSDLTPGQRYVLSRSPVLEQ